MHGPSPRPSARVAAKRNPFLAALRQLRRNDVDLVSWSRELPPDLGPALRDWARTSPPQLEDLIELPHHDLSNATIGLAGAARSWLMADVEKLLTRFSRFANVRRLRVSFGPIRGDQCRKFHVDYVRYRLVTTYVGPGTEWVPEAAVCRSSLCSSTDCPLTANRAIVPDASAVKHAGPGDVLVMKGALHPECRGAVHRSPPLEGTGAARIVLVATTVDAS
jgi:hypothetical protein